MWNSKFLTNNKQTMKKTIILIIATLLSISAISQTTGTSGINGSGTVGYLSKFSGTKKISNSILFQSSNNIGIGTNSPSYTLDVVGSIRTSQRLYIGSGTNTASQFYVKGNVTDFYLAFESAGGGAVMYVTPSGNTSIGTYQDTYKLAVAGSFASPKIIDDGSNIKLLSIPTSSTGLPSGAIWSDSGTLKIVP